MATAAKIEVPPLIPFDPISEPTSVSQRWKAWKRCFEIYLIAVNVKDDAQKRALLRCYIKQGRRHKKSLIL